MIRPAQLQPAPSEAADDSVDAHGRTQPTSHELASQLVRDPFSRIGTPCNIQSQVQPMLAARPAHRTCRPLNRELLTLVWKVSSHVASSSLYLCSFAQRRPV